MSEHFQIEEFACHDGCGFCLPNPKLIAALEKLRALIGKPIIINSGCRCKKQNAKVGGEVNSQHLMGNAADIVAHGATMNELFVAATEIPEFKQGGIGIYDTWVHVDVRNTGTPARWDKRQRRPKK